ncbi:type IV pili methyl-accepting chemotaxis transducer N-terminal domain-containing protein [Flammeovirga yaeyamensis]|uniref:Oxygen sensor histidine kinase NreB n=1 Tax=Flammeovirga yaeyamensis TaxID=367791 RepID=A0AAX1N7E9_9BACT|nr:ATP-binding protein [Flammeovirga yaeyamensis]MBB3698041.1 signal transduction histidine kinase [Flammeovirga yaeyamensis]NMF35607.1 histidine kinase [Flammeovirga yaeyamensis]QWG03435.1 type IV pili methyl-accepting chemotaxis transducer N-terminal domain-containing protein [Flammeovirga yaeyamensis]
MQKTNKHTRTLTHRIEKLSLKKLWTLYSIAITIIILLLTFSQIINYSFSQKQSVDADIINMAGRQRMLSQKITKCILLIHNDHAPDTYAKELKKAIQLWKKSHEQLGKHNTKINNEIIKSDADFLYAKSDAFLKKIIDDAKGFSDQSSKEVVQEILDNEAYYLVHMDQLVGIYSDYANYKLKLVQNTSILLFIITLVILFFELFYVFRPTATRINKTIAELEKTKNINHEKIQEIDQLYRSLGQAYQHLSESKETDENLHATLAKVNMEGDFTFISEKLFDIIQTKADDFTSSLYYWLASEGYKKEMIQEILDIVINGETWAGTIKVTDAEGDFKWLEIILSKIYGKPTEILIVGRDITDQKESEERSKEINQEEIDKHIETQKSRSLLILKGQEEERGRISKDIHDGIGQLLTALKFSLESINPAQVKISTNKLKESKGLLKNIIREVRRVSFNLSPNTLGDYGIHAVLTRFAQETSRLSDVEIKYSNTSDFNQRFEKHIETNIYRIVQEAVNNAIKYAEAEEVDIHLSHDFEALYIEISDNGKGFDMNNLEIHGGGNGLLNMKERAGFVGGEISVSSAKGKGTKISVEVPIEEN